MDIHGLQGESVPIPFQLLLQPKHHRVVNQEILPELEFESLLIGETPLEFAVVEFNLVLHSQLHVDFLPVSRGRGVVELASQDLALVLACPANQFTTNHEGGKSYERDVSLRR